MRRSVRRNNPVGRWQRGSIGCWRWWDAKATQRDDRTCVLSPESVTVVPQRGLASDVRGVLVIAQTDKRGVPKMTISGPLDEPNLCHELPLQPPHLRHLFGRDAPAPV